MNLDFEEAAAPRTRLPTRPDEHAPARARARAARLTTTTARFVTDAQIADPTVADPGGPHARRAR